VQQCNLLKFLSSTCFGRIRPSSGALDVKLQHMVFCTQFVDGWSQSHGTIQTVHTTYAAALKTHHPSTNRVQKNVCRNLTSSAPDDGRMRPKHVELRNFNKLHCCTKLAFHFITPEAYHYALSSLLDSMLCQHPVLEYTQTLFFLQSGRLSL